MAPIKDGEVVVAGTTAAGGRGAWRQGLSSEHSRGKWGFLAKERVEVSRWEITKGKHQGEGRLAELSSGFLGRRPAEEA